MRSSKSTFGATLFAACVFASPASAQQAQGFAVERFYPSAPGGGWLVMDTLDMSGGLGGVMGLTLGYARHPLRVGGERLAVVSDQAFADLGFGATYGRFRLFVNFDAPLLVGGGSGTADGFTFAAPSVDPASNPDTLSDVRIGGLARLFGVADGAFRLGAGAQLFVPNGLRDDYVTDHTYRAMGRLLFAGDVGSFTYAGHLGVHVRPLDDDAPGGPRGSELLFGVAGGVKVSRHSTAFIIGPEVYGVSALKSMFGAETTGLEALLGARVEGTEGRGAQLRFKLGAGAGIHPRFGAPEGRMVLAIEVFDRAR